MQIDFRRIAIVNRGHVAMRFINSVREFNREHATDIRTLALFTEPERGAAYVREADDAVGLGSSSFVDDRTGRRKSRYADYAAVRAAIASGRADAAWVGWGFSPDHLRFAELCEKLDITLLGPGLAAITQLGDKIATKRLAARLDIPVVPWSQSAVESLDDARAAASKVGYPLVLKAAVGGAGRGLQAVADAGELEPAYARVRSFSEQYYDRATLLVEKRVVGARLISVQTLADSHGTVWDIGLRDGSVQRGFGKMLDEGPPVGLAATLLDDLRRWAVALVGAASYEGAGSVEFLVDEAGRPLLLEVNPRLETAHDLVEATTGIDLIKHQILVARGGRLEGPAPQQRGHAFEVRVRAEDPARGFEPTPGIVDAFRPPMGPGIRVEASIADGDEVPPGLSTMVCKLVASGKSRTEALTRIERALRDAVVAIRGGESTRSFLLTLVSRDEVRAGPVDVDWLDRLAASGEILRPPHREVALLAAAIEEHDRHAERDRGAFLASAARGRPAVRTEITRSVEVTYVGQRHRFTCARLGPDEYAVEVGGKRLAVSYLRQGSLERRLSVSGGAPYRVVLVHDWLGFQVVVDGFAHRIYGDEGGLVRSPAPGMVQAVRVKPGDVVQRGDVLLQIEAMKMVTTVTAPFPGQVREVFAVSNVPAPAGAPLLVLGGLPLADGAPQAAADAPVSFTAPAPSQPTAAAPTPVARWVESLRRLRLMVLGYDFEATRIKQLQADLDDAARTTGHADSAVLAAEIALVRAFVDVAGLFRRRPGSDDTVEEEYDGIGTEEYFNTYLRTLDPGAGRLPQRFLEELRTALAHYGVADLEPGPALEEALFRMFKHHHRVDGAARVVAQILERWTNNADGLRPRADATVAALLDGVVRVSRRHHRNLTDLALEASYRFFARPTIEAARARAHAEAERDLELLATEPPGPGRSAILGRLVSSPVPLSSLFGQRFLAAAASAPARERMLEVLLARYYRRHAIGPIEPLAVPGTVGVRADLTDDKEPVQVVFVYSDHRDLAATLARLGAAMARPGATIIDVSVGATEALPPTEELATSIPGALAGAGLPPAVRRVSLALAAPGIARARHFTFVPAPAGGFTEERRFRGLHPMIAERLRLARLADFELELVGGGQDVYLWKAVARANPRDERLIAFADVRDLTAVRDEAGRVTGYPHLELIFNETLAALRLEQSKRRVDQRLHWNRVELNVWPPLDISPADLERLVEKLEPATEGLGLEKVVTRAPMVVPGTSTMRLREIHAAKPTGMSLSLTVTDAGEEPIRPLSEYDQKVVRLRQRGLTYPLEIVRMLTRARDDHAAAFPPGEFIEHDLEGDELVPVKRAPGKNTANIIVGVLRNFTTKYPEGMTRVAMLSDPSRNLGSLAEPECRRINAALALAHRMKVPVEWFALSSGAKIAMDSGTENMDWIALTLRRLIEFTQAGNEINVIVMGINVGGQPYWNAEATMLSHTKGILIMMPQSAMVLTGKRALDYSGGQSAEDDFGIGGYDRIMGLNGQAQYFAKDIADACRILFAHYEHCYVVPGERFPRRAQTTDPATRDIGAMPHGDGFATVGEVFTNEKNPGRKKPFHIRRIMAAAIDQDHQPLERWHDMRDAEIAVVCDAHIGGYPVMLLGLESEPIPRRGPLPADGPEQWTGGTLFPMASKKVARAINTATMNRPIVILANLSGFDGSPESMRGCQLEFGAEIGRAVVNYRGPIVFCVVSRFHGGAYVVFSRTLNENIEVTALEGTYASVIGGGPAAGVVFAGEVEARAKKDPRAQALEARIAQASDAEKRKLRAELDDVMRLLRAEKVGIIADEFDREHSVERALRVGSLHRIIPPVSIRPYLIDALERGMKKELERIAGR